MAPKKAPKKAAKKGLGPHHHEGSKDLRRAYEHLGRIEAIEPSLPESVRSQIAALTGLSQRSLNAGDARSSAELLRACEHIAFGSLAPAGKEPVSPALREAIERHYEKLREEAIDAHEEHDPSSVRDAFEWAFSMADNAYAKGSFRRALEMIRAAAALAHVHGDHVPDLPSPGKTKHLKQ